MLNILFFLLTRYVNIGRSHDHYIYPLHVDLASAVRSNIISRLHASVRFDLDAETWMVQVFGRFRKGKEKEECGVINFFSR